MAGYSLLTRIKRPELAAARRVISDAEVRDSILSHLRNMCQTRQGTMVTCPEYGVPDVSEIIYNFPDAIALMAKAMKQSIALYEPRLAAVVIKHIPFDGTDLNLRFEISGRLINGDHKSNVRFETAVDPKREVSVK